MQMRLAALIATVISVGCVRAAAQAAAGRPRAAVDSIVLERTRCFGTCPAYGLRIDRAAEVVFESHNPGDTRPAARDTVAGWVPDSLAAQLARIGFAELPDQIAGSALCPDSATDHPTLTVAVFGVRPKRVVYYTGCYLRSDHARAQSLVALGQFAARMDTLTGAPRWIQPARRR